MLIGSPGFEIYGTVHFRYIGVRARDPEMNVLISTVSIYHCVFEAYVILVRVILFLRRL